MAFLWVFVKSTGHKHSSGALKLSEASREAGSNCAGRTKVAEAGTAPGKPPASLPCRLGCRGPPQHNPTRPGRGLLCLLWSEQKAHCHPFFS